MRRLDVAPSLPSDDHAMDGIASLAERKREGGTRPLTAHASASEKERRSN
jgi:hypothetical protein